MKKVLALIVALVFAIGVAGFSFASSDVKGTVTKVEGSKITVKDSSGNETTVEVKSASGVKAGDKVEIEDGKVKKEEKKKKKRKIEGC